MVITQIMVVFLTMFAIIHSEADYTNHHDILSAIAEEQWANASHLIIEAHKNNGLPPGLKREAWKVWFNHANNLSRSAAKKAAVRVYGMLCGVSSHGCTMDACGIGTIPVALLPFTRFRACGAMAKVRNQIGDSRGALVAMVLSCTYSAVETDPDTAHGICRKVLRSIASISEERPLIPFRLHVEETLANIERRKGFKNQTMIHSSTPLSLKFLSPAWDLANSMDRVMTFIYRAAIRLQNNKEVSIISNNSVKSPDVVWIHDDCFVFGTRRKIAPTRIPPGAVRIRMEDECPRGLCDACIGHADVFLFSYLKEMNAASTQSLAKKKVFVHTPQPADPELFGGIELERQSHARRPIDVLLTGCVDGFEDNIGGTTGSGLGWLYPFRQRLMRLIKSGRMPGSNNKVRVHPGYNALGGGADAVQNLENATRRGLEQLWGYASQLKQAKIVLVTKSARDYALRKYTEAAFSGALLIGDIPTERRALWQRIVVRISMDDSDDVITKRVSWWLQHHEERYQKSKLGQTAVREWTWQKKVQAALGGAVLFMQQKFGAWTFGQAIKAYTQTMQHQTQDTVMMKRHNLTQIPKWWGVYVGWISYGNLGDDALLQLFLELILKGELQAKLQATDSAPLLCDAVRHGTARTKPRFVALGGGSTLHPTYTALVESLLRKYPYTPAFVFGSGVDDYTGTIRSSSDVALLFEECAKKGQLSMGESPTVFHDSSGNKRAGVSESSFRFGLFQRRSTLGGVRGMLSSCILRGLAKHRQHRLVPHIYDPGLLAGFSSSWHNNLDKRSRRAKWKISGDRRKLGKVILNLGHSGRSHFAYGNDTHALKLFSKVASMLTRTKSATNVTFVALWNRDVPLVEAASKFSGAYFNGKSEKTLQGFMDHMEHADVVVCWRLHCAVFAHSVGIPWVLLAYRLKAFEFAASVDMLDRVIGMDVATPALVLQRVHTIVNQPFAWRKDVEGAREGWNAAANHLRSRIGDSKNSCVREICKARSKVESTFAIIGPCQRR